jgi:hypothetical protein
MTMAMGQGQFVAKSGARNLTTGTILFQANNTSDPAVANTEDPCNLVSGIVYSATGIQTITLRDRWQYVHATAQCLDATGGVIAKVTAVTAGRSAANTIVLQTEIADGTPTAVTAKDIVVTVSLYR